MKERKLCLVTGASGGIGRSISRELAAAGYTVILQGRDHDKLVEIRKELRHNSHAVFGDLTNKKDRTRILNEAFHYGDIELLVNNAGSSFFSSFADSDPEDLESLMDINLLSPVLFTHQFLKHINTVNEAYGIQHQTTIVNVGSTFGSIGYPGFSLYCAGKFGLRGFTESLSRELADTHIRMLYFAPRATNTKINSKIVDDMNKVLGNACDSPEFVGKEFMALLNSHKIRKFVGWPEKILVRLNGAFPEIVDGAIASKLQKIKQFLSLEKKTMRSSKIALVEEK
ncbi:SDR family oxidoreductase [Colwelliaceae bacterium 6441]